MVTEAAETACAVVRAALDGSGVAVGLGASASSARLLLATKNPHAGSGECLASILARCIAFGIEVHRIRRLSTGEADNIAKILYSTAWLNFERGPVSEASWEQIDARFDRPEFEAIFGKSFDRGLVLSASRVLEQSDHLTATELESIWNEGRAPISADEFSRRYGDRAAQLVSDGRRDIDWFHSSFPLGIQQISSGLVAFAMRHPKIFGGNPCVVINGHCLALAARFHSDSGIGSYLVELGLQADGPTVRTVREWIIGADNRPEKCLPGTVRGDAASGQFPTAASDIPVSAWANLVHCSDGYLAGLLETMLVLGGTLRGRLPQELQEFGYSRGEVTEILFRDPVVTVRGAERRLTEITCGQSIDECIESIRRFCPPAFGPLNGFGGGLSAQKFMDCAAVLYSLHGDVSEFSRSTEKIFPVTEDLDYPEIGSEDESLGLDAIAGGSLGVLLPAAGTGGRFGGYHLAESDVRRHKSLAKVFEVNGRSMSGLDIRIANSRYWIERTGGDIPIVVAASHNTRPGIDEWVSTVRAAEISVLDLPAIPRFRADIFRGGEHSIASQDFLLRNSDGTPNGKSAGPLGLIMQFAINGLLSEWVSRGVEFVAVCNSDDVGFRIDPALVGLLKRNSDIDAILSVVPVGFTGSVSRNGRETLIRGDMSGWCVDSEGHDVSGDMLVLSETSTEKGGYLGRVLRNCVTRTIVVEHAVVSDRIGEFRYLNTNQFYFRTRSLVQALGGAERVDQPESLSTVRESFPIYAERKSVAIGGDSVDAVQLYQPIGEILRALTNVLPIVTSRAPRPSALSGYMPLKSVNDVAFAQNYLNIAAAIGDELIC
ncbi:hypothetical protein ACQPXH_25155 [Nocardia sp. CA-135953]|uniref:hypothetical protein n=1 Tax=Nocardia sp. CA-135953 TaxID=3239978 RepID=UPI003D97CEFD